MNIADDYVKYYQLMVFSHMAQQERHKPNKAMTRPHKLIKVAADEPHPMRLFT
jgi:hypothetical protein